MPASPVASSAREAGSGVAVTSGGGGGDVGLGAAMSPEPKLSDTAFVMSRRDASKTWYELSPSVLKKSTLKSPKRKSVGGTQVGGHRGATGSAVGSLSWISLKTCSTKSIPPSVFGSGMFLNTSDPSMPVYCPVWPALPKNDTYGLVGELGSGGSPGSG